MFRHVSTTDFRKGAPDGKHGADFAARLYNDGVDLFREWTAIDVIVGKTLLISYYPEMQASQKVHSILNQRLSNRLTDPPPQPPVSDHRDHVVSML